MALPLYLAMTASEIQKNPLLPPYFSYMACHFSSYGTGLSNFPHFLPEGTLLILNDRTPIHGHDCRQITGELESIVARFRCSGILLDFQRQDCEESSALAHWLSASLPCPVAVSAAYAADLSGPVFLPPIPLDMALSDYLRPWMGREIWLEAALDGLEITITPSGYAAFPLDVHCFRDGFSQDTLHCHYHIEVNQDQAKFTLFRTRDDLDELLAEASTLGVTQAVGLWQELSSK